MYSCSISVRLPKLSPLSTASSMRGRLCSCSFGELVNFHTVSGTFLAAQARVHIVHKLALLEDPDSYLLWAKHSNTHNLPMLHSPIPSSYGLIWPRDCVVQSTLGQIAGQGMCTVQCIPRIVGLCTVHRLLYSRLTYPTCGHHAPSAIFACSCVLPYLLEPT